jgi:hypothetical protein
MNASPLIALALLLGGCAGTVVQEKPVTVLTPVTVPCVSPARPDETKALKLKMTKKQWDALDVKQRQDLLLAQGMDRKAYGDKLYVSTAGCL